MEAGSDRVRKAKVHLEFIPPRAVKSSEKGFHRYISRKMKTREKGPAVEWCISGAP